MKISGFPYIHNALEGIQKLIFRPVIKDRIRRLIRRNKKILSEVLDYPPESLGYQWRNLALATNELKIEILLAFLGEEANDHES